LPAAEVLLELRPELAHGVLHWPTGAVGQAADRRARHDADGIANLLQDLQVLQPALATAEALHDLVHPAGALAARRTLAARLVGEEPGDVVHDVHDAGRLVENRHRGG